MEETVVPGETATPPVAPAAPAASVEPAAPTGSEPDTNSGDEPSTVPSARLREETEKRRKAEEDNVRLQQELDAARTPQSPAGDDDLDPDVEELVRKSAKKLGLVSQEDLAAERQKVQVQQDVRDLVSTPPVAGIPYNHQDVMEYAKSNGLPITSKAALSAAYKELNWNKIVEGERQRAIDGYKSAGSSGAETPGSGGATPPPEPALTSKNPKDRTRERIRNARAKLAV